MITGLHMGLSSGVNPSRVVYPADGASLALMMGYGTAPNLLARFDSLSAPIPDLAGGDDPIDAIRAGVALAENRVLGTSALIEEDSAYWCYYTSATKFDPALGSFAHLVVGDIKTLPGSRTLAYKRDLLSSGAGWRLAISGLGYVQFETDDGSSTATAQVPTGLGRMAAIFGVDRTAGTAFLYTWEEASIVAPPAGSVTSTTPMRLGGGGATPRWDMAMWATWIGAEGFAQEHAANLWASMRLS